MRVSQKAAALMDAMMDDSTEDEDDSAAAADGTSTAADDTSTAVAAEAPELESSEKTIGDAASKLGLRKSASGGGGGAAQQARMAMIVQVRRQSGLVLSCRVLSCLVLSCLVLCFLSCPVLSCLVHQIFRLFSFTELRFVVVVFVCTSQNFEEGDEGWDAEGGSTIAVEAGASDTHTSNILLP